MVGLSRKRVFPKTKGDSITGQDRAQKHCDFRFSQIEKKSKVAVLQLGLKSSLSLSQLGPGSTRPESTRPGVFSEQICDMFCFLYVHNHSDLIKDKH